MVDVLLGPQTVKQAHRTRRKTVWASPRQYTWIIELKNYQSIMPLKSTIYHQNFMIQSLRVATGLFRPFVYISTFHAPRVMTPSGHSIVMVDSPHYSDVFDVVPTMFTHFPSRPVKTAKWPRTITRPTTAFSSPGAPGPHTPNRSSHSNRRTTYHTCILTLLRRSCH